MSNVFLFLKNVFEYIAFETAFNFQFYLFCVHKTCYVRNIFFSMDLTKNW